MYPIYQDPFVLDKEAYKRDIYPFQHYKADTAFFLSKMHGIPIEEASRFVDSNTNAKNPQAFYPLDKQRIVTIDVNQHGDRYINTNEDNNLYNFIYDACKQGQIITPPFSIFKPEKEQKAYLVDYIDFNVKARGKAKKEMFKYKMAGDTNNFIIKKNEQNNKKINNNSISGASCIPTTPIYHSTMHPSLTSTCRITAAYANANNEKMLGGNRHYFNPDITLANIISICRNTDYTQLQFIMDKYQLHYPTTDEVMEVIEYSSDLYYKHRKKHILIRDLVDKLSPLERAAFVYTGDLYHLRKFNDKVIRDLLTKLSKKHEIKDLENHIEIIEKGPEAIYFLASQYCRQETKGIDVSKPETKNGDLGRLLATNMLEVYKVIEEYKDFFICFFRTVNKPSSISHFKDSMRRVVIMSDTDSTIFSVEEWIEWYFGEITFSDEANNLFAALVFLAVSALKHLLAMMSINLGVDRDKIHLIAMKNEFKFEIFVPTTNTKHYYALITYQEGNIYKVPDMEIKGVHLKNSNTPKFINEEASSMMRDICTNIVSGNKLSISTYISKAADIERLIENTLKEGRVNFFRYATIKEANAYAKGEDESVYKAHVFWNATFGKLYGIMPDPPYSVYKVNTRINNKTEMKDYVDSLENKDLANDIMSYLQKEKKDIIKTLYVPMDLYTGQTLPKEIIDLINIRKMVADINHTLYHILSTLGIYRLNSDFTRLFYDDF